MTLFALILGPLVGWLVSIINKRFRRYSRRIQDSMGDVTRVAKEIFEAPRLIKVYNAQEHLGRQFEAVNEHNLRSNMRLILTKGLANPVVQLVTAIGGSPVLAYAISKRGPWPDDYRRAARIPDGPGDASRNPCGISSVSRDPCSRESPARRACSK